MLVINTLPTGGAIRTENRSGDRLEMEEIEEIETTETTEGQILAKTHTTWYHKFLLITSSCCLISSIDGTQTAPIVRISSIGYRRNQ